MEPNTHTYPLSPLVHLIQIGRRSDRMRNGWCQGAASERGEQEPVVIDIGQSNVPDESKRFPTIFSVVADESGGSNRVDAVEPLCQKGTCMALTNGFNHVATLCTDMDVTVGFYEEVFDATVTFEVVKSDHHPWMKIVDLGGGAALNIFEVPAEEIIGERRRQGGRGAIDHFALAVTSNVDLEVVKTRLSASGAQEVGEIQRLGNDWSLFFRDPDGMELEVCCPAEN